MSLASLWSGMALANAGLGAVHGLAGPLGGMFPAPHGAICAALLPHVCAANLRACRETGRDDVVARFVTIARLLTGEPHATADDGVAALRTLVSDLAIRPLRTYGIADSDLAAVADQASRASSMKANPIALSDATLREVLAAAL
jgi:alcohol dehydrogenase class IV